MNDMVCSVVVRVVDCRDRMSLKGVGVGGQWCGDDQNQYDVYVQPLTYYFIFKLRSRRWIMNTYVHKFKIVNSNLRIGAMLMLRHNP